MLLPTFSVSLYSPESRILTSSPLVAELIAACIELKLQPVEHTEITVAFAEDAKIRKHINEKSIFRTTDFICLIREFLLKLLTDSFNFDNSGFFIRFKFYPQNFIDDSHVGFAVVRNFLDFYFRRAMGQGEKN